MSSSTPFILRWGILGCGRISGTFARDLLLPPSGRGASESDVAHAITAVGSRSLAKAEEFVKENCPQGGWAQVRGLTSGGDGVVAAVQGYENVVNMQVGVLSNAETPCSCCWSFIAECGHHIRWYTSSESRQYQRIYPPLQAVYPKESFRSMTTASSLSQQENTFFSRKYAIYSYLHINFTAHLLVYIYLSARDSQQPRIHRALSSCQIQETVPDGSRLDAVLPVDLCASRCAV
jgi:hypothetical protein